MIIFSVGRYCGGEEKMLDTSILGSIARQMMTSDEVEIEGKRLNVGRTSRQGLRTVTFTMEERQFAAIEQNPIKPSRWGKLARACPLLYLPVGGKADMACSNPARRGSNAMGSLRFELLGMLSTPRLGINSGETAGFSGSKGTEVSVKRTRGDGSAVGAATIP